MSGMLAAYHERMMQSTYIVVNHVVVIDSGSAQARRPGEPSARAGLGSTNASTAEIGSEADRARDQEVYDEWRVTYYWGAD
jgi:hypothetical protein